MAFDLNLFLQQGLVYGGARTSKFDIQLTLPTGLTGIDSTFVQKFNFTCRAASIPSFRLGEVQIPYFGRKIKSAGDRVWDDWRITIMLDEDYVTRNAFEAWSNAINRLESNVMQANFDGESYKSRWNVTQYSKDGSTIGLYEVINGWPRVVGPVMLDWNGTDRISEFEVDVAFDNFAPTGATPTFPDTTSTTYFSQIDTVG